MNEEEIKLSLSKKINSFINNCYPTQSKGYNYFIKPEQISIIVEQYGLFGKVEQSENILKNNITIIRSQITELVSIHSNRIIGSVLYCDSFLRHSEHLFNLTHDICTFRFLSSSNMHINRKHDYDIPNYLITMFEKKPLIIDKEFQGVMFFNNDYKLSYLSQSEDNYNYFIYLDGKLSFLDGYIYLSDQSLGHIIIENNNIITIELREEIKYTYLLIKLADNSKIPLTNIVKNEILIYFSNSSIKSFKTELFSRLKSDYKVETINNVKNDFYYKLAYFIFENEKENINYMSNSFALEKIKTILTNHLDFENLYLRLKNKDKNLTFDEYSQIKKLAKSPTDISKVDNKKIKLLFVFGNINSNYEVFAEYLLEAAKSVNKNSSIIIIKRSDIISLKSYADLIGVSANSNLDKNFNKLLILPVGLENEISCFLYNLSEFFGGLSKFFEIFEIINICYCVNYSCFLRNPNNDLFQIFKNITQEDLCKFLLIDESDVSKRKVDRFNNLIQLANKNCTFYNKRTFSRNPKEIKKIITDSYFNESYLQKLFNLNYFKTDNLAIDNQFFFKTEFFILRDLFNEFISKYLNNHLNPINLKEQSKKKEGELVYNNYSNRYMNNFDFHDDLLIEIEEFNSFYNFPVIEKVNGVIKFDDARDTFYEIKINHKLLSIEEYKKKINTDELGLTIVGKNFFCSKETEILLITKLKNLFGCFPELKVNLTRDTLSKEVIDKLNVNNFFRDLPIDYDTDGIYFVDEKGNKSEMHPKIEFFIQEYLDKENKNINEYNQKSQLEINSHKIL